MSAQRKQGERKAEEGKEIRKDKTTEQKQKGNKTKTKRKRRKGKKRKRLN